MKLAHLTAIQHPDDVREALGFQGQPRGVNLIALYEQALRNKDDKFSKADLRIAWKLASDRYYWRAFNLYNNFAIIEEAGFYDDGLEPGTLDHHKDHKHLTTPLETIRNKLSTLKKAGTIHNKPLVVMLTTGGFAPVHEGHIAMMRAAEKSLQNAGYEVLGGYMSPDHDAYVSGKGEDARRLSADFRTTLLSRVLEEQDGLDVDEWTSRYAPKDVNFTDVVGRLRTYVNAHLNSPADIKIAYVFGGDNAQFTRAFVDSDDVAVCVSRPGGTKAEKLAEKSGLADKQNIIFTESTDLNVSSKRIRDGELPPIDKLSEDKNWLQWLKGEPRQPDGNSETAYYLVRDDLSWAVAPWKNKIDNDVLKEAVTEFSAGLARAVKNAFEQSRAHGYPETVEVVHLPLEKQIEAANEIMAMTPDRVLNNDLITAGPRSAIGISRLFNLSGAQIAGKKVIPRSDNGDLAEVLGSLKKGEYLFVDDDIATGTTARLLEAQLPDGVTFSDKIALSERAFKALHPDRDYSFWDIVDARDFLMGSQNSGLVVQLFNGAVGRAPYMLPYTSLVNRAKIPPDQEKEFSKEVLNLNERFFRRIWADLELRDTDPQFQALMGSIGFKNRMRMSDLCDWHLSHAPG